MPPADVAAIVTAVASALDYAHKQGLLHRDVKPANVMLTHTDDDGDRRILLADFGIARTMDDVSGLTATNMTVGTVAYCAPEQLMGEPVDGRADQYSLAATAYHLLTGNTVFPHTNPAVIISRHLNADPPLRIRRTAMSAALTSLKRSVNKSHRRARQSRHQPHRPLPLRNSRRAQLRPQGSQPLRQRSNREPRKRRQRGLRARQ
jgi:serine/threonine protein kinase